MTNQLTTRVTANESQIVPALGESVGHMIPQRLMLGSLPNSTNLTAVLMKSSCLPSNGANFEVNLLILYICVIFVSNVIIK